MFWLSCTIHSKIALQEILFVLFLLNVFRRNKEIILIELNRLISQSVNQSINQSVIESFNQSIERIGS